MKTFDSAARHGSTASSATSRDWQILWVGSLGLIILGLHPILLGALFNEGRVTLDQTGLIATLEILAIGIGRLSSRCGRRGACG